MTLSKREQLIKLNNRHNSLVIKMMRGYNYLKYDRQSARAEVECRIVQTSDVIGELEKLQWRSY